ncbi:hypothetical protein EDB19DRAFT_1824046 [Suillus lakei]|nr:hypothetical protein EDB19DRAFT_1824046 [Suillus lakei]
MPNIMPADSESSFNFTFDASSLIGASAHDFNNDFNPSQWPGAMLFMAYQYLSVDLTPSDSALSLTCIVHPSRYTQSHSLLPALSSQSSSNSSNLTSTLDPTTKECLLVEATGEAFLMLFQYNELEVQVHSAIRESRVALAVLRPTPLQVPIILTTAATPPSDTSEDSGPTVIALLPCLGFHILNWPMSDGTPVQANLPWLCTAEGLDKLSFDLEVISRKALARSFDCTIRELVWRVADFLTQSCDQGKTLTWLHLRLSDKVEQQLMINLETSTAATSNQVQHLPKIGGAFNERARINISNDGLSYINWESMQKHHYLARKPQCVHQLYSNLGTVPRSCTLAPMLYLYGQLCVFAKIRTLELQQ